VIYQFCLDDGHEVVIYETLDFYGGQWVYVEDDSPETHSSCYKNMLAATPKKTMEYSHYPMSDKYPNVRDFSVFSSSDHNLKCDVVLRSYAHGDRFWITSKSMVRYADVSFEIELYSNPDTHFFAVPRS
jgi:cation diffusion facilitator CzcD-associated flavoprotein CzcO